MHKIVKKAQAGDAYAFGELVRMFQDAVYGVAYTNIGNFQDAQDIAQEVFIQAWRDLGSLKEPARFPNWLCRIAKNRCMDFLRRKKLNTVELEEAKTVLDPLPLPLEQAEKKELAEIVLSAVKALPEKLLLTTTLFYINGYTVNEVAEFLKVPTGTIKRRLHDSREHLKEDIMKDKKMVEILVGDTLKSFPLPGNFADVVVRMVASEEDIRQYDELMQDSTESVAEAQQHGKFLVTEEEQVESAGMINVGPWLVGSTIVKSATSHAGVAGESEGVPDPIFVKGFQGHLKLAKEKGCRLIMVHGSQYDHAFCGFVPCFYYPVITLPCEKAKSIVTEATIAEANPEEKKAAKEFGPYPYVTKFSAYIGNWTMHVIKQNGEVVGYVDVDHNFIPEDNYGMPFGHVGGMWRIPNTTRDAVLAVIRLAAELTEKVGDEEICIMQPHTTLLTQTMLRLGGKYLLRPSCDVIGLDAEMVAIIDLIGLTQDLQSEFQSRLNASPVYDVDGSFSIEMSGMTIGFIVKSGNVEIATKKQKRHRILPRWVITRLYTGYYSGEDVLTMGPIPYDRSDGKTPDDPNLDMKELHLPENEAALFKALFPKLWPCSMPDPDVWPWVIGEEHPRYQHEDLKTSEMKAKIDALQFPWIGY